MKLLVSRKNIYGNALIYPECEKSKLFCEISEKKTLTPWVIARVKRLGYTLDK